MNNDGLPPGLRYDLTEENTDITTTANIEVEINDDTEKPSEDQIADEIVEFVEPQPIEETDIFDKTPVVKKVVEEQEEEVKKPIALKENGKPITYNKNGKPRKKLSPEHLLKLQEARKKALEVKRQNKLKNQASKQEEQLKRVAIKKNKQLKKELELEKSVMELSEMVNQVNEIKSKQKKVVVEEPTPPPKEIVKNEPVLSGLTKKDLFDAQLDAITKYDMVRKQRKQVKKQNKLVEQQKQDMVRAIKQSGWKDTAGYYADCF
jgi:hypothetical protein